MSKSKHLKSLQILGQKYETKEKQGDKRVKQKKSFLNYDGSNS